MEQMELPPGFRFHPTDEELITHYLSKKVLDGNFEAVAIGEVDLNKCEPWDLPWRAKMGEEWYLFCVRDRKYPTGLRTNRATESGYWKATGKDKEIYRGKRLVGMKKTLVFYRGRAPKGEKTDWVMHEYRLEGKSNYSAVYDLPINTRNEWVICRVFNKSSAGGKKGCPVAKGGLLQQVRMEVGSSSSASYGSSDELDNEGKANSSLLPPLMDVNIIKEKINGASEPTAAAAHVTCFSNAVVLEDQKGIVEEEKYSTNPNLSLDFNKTATTTSTGTTSGPFAASHASPSSTFISKVNMNMSAAPSNPLGLNMHHHHHQQQQQHYITNPSGSLMKLLLQSNVYGVVMDQQQNGSKGTDKEMLSNISQETGLTTDLNPEIEISSVSNNDDNVPNANNEVPSTSAALPLHLDDCLWGY